MSYFLVGSLKRGIIDPPERLDANTEWHLEQSYHLSAMERDPPLTIEQLWREQGIILRKEQVQRRIA